jgi:hypothetical protein
VANTFLTPSYFVQSGLDILENEIVFGNKVRTDLSDQFQMVGDTINIRRQTMYAGQANNLDITSYREDIVEGKVPVKMDQTFSIAVDIGAIDATLSFDRIDREVIRPAMVKFAEQIDSAIAATYPQFYHFQGTPGTSISTFAHLAGAGALMTDYAIPQTDRFAIHSPTAGANLADGVKTAYVQDIAKTALQQATIGRYAGIDNYYSALVPTHTVGGLGGTPLINGASQNVTYVASKDTWTQSLITDGWTAAAANRLKAGDVITIANVFGVNPNTKVSTGRLMTFSVQADAASDGSGNATLTISPPIITSGAYQTVTAAPADNAAITVLTGSASTGYRQSLILHPDAIALVSRPLMIPQGMGVKTATKQGNKVTISATEYVNGNTLAHTIRFDMLYKAVAVDTRLGMRFTN